MAAPVIGFTAEVERGLNGASFVQIEPWHDGSAIEVMLSPLDATGLAIRKRSITVSHNEAREIIAGLASVIT